MEPQLSPARAGQRGTALFVALIMLVAMSIAAVSLVRSVDTTVVVSGNLAFQQAALQAADYGIEAAVTRLRTLPKESRWTLAGSTASDENANYRPVMFAPSALGSPKVGGTSIAIPGAPSVDWSKIPSLPSDDSPAGYTVQYLIDRMCTGTPPITDLAANCISSGTEQPGGSKTGGVGETPFTWVLSIQYRVTVRVAGPNNAQSFVQVMLAD